MIDIWEKLAAKLTENPAYRVLRQVTGLESVPGKPSGPITRVIVLDTETTGLDPEEDRIIDIGIIAMDVITETGELVRITDTYECLEDPGRPLPENIVALTGLKDEAVKGKRINDAAVAKICADAGLVIAHGAFHDRPFLEKRFPLFATLPWACSLSEINWREQGMGSAKLDYLAFRIGMFYEGHRALIDSHALANVLVRAKLHSGQTPLQALIDASLSCEYRIFADRAPFEKKDLLRTNGFRWDADLRVWHCKALGDDDFARTTEWLHQEVYDTKPARINVESCDALVKHSNRSGKVFLYTLGAMGDQTGVENRRGRAGLTGQ